MRRVKFITGALVLAAVIAGQGLRCHAKPGGQGYFPMTAGTVWLYRGVTRWRDPRTSSPREQTVTWKMEVLRVITRGNVQAAVLKGHPQDLIWFEPNERPGDYLLVRVARNFYLLQGNRMRRALVRLADPADRLDHLVNDDEMILSAPLAVHKAFGERGQLSRKDRSYCWFVQGAAPVDPSGPDSLAVEDGRIQYRLLFRTVPDETTVDFVPGVGITRYRYVHHGTVAATDVRLIKFIPGPESQAQSRRGA